MPSSRASGRLQNELSSETLLTSLAQARIALLMLVAGYNDTPPHSQLGRKMPSEFAFLHPHRELALPYVEGSAPVSVATTADRANPTARPNSEPDKTLGGQLTS
jgi:hypothetical protein